RAIKVVHNQLVKHRRVLGEEPGHIRPALASFPIHPPQTGLLGRAKGVARDSRDAPAAVDPLRGKETPQLTQLAGRDIFVPAPAFQKQARDSQRLDGAQYLLPGFRRSQMALDISRGAINADLQRLPWSRKAMAGHDENQEAGAN